MEASPGTAQGSEPRDAPTLHEALEIVRRRRGIFTAEVVGSVDDGLADAWRELALRRENPFVLPEWHSAWLETHPGARPVVIVVRRGAEVAGVIPLVSTVGSRWVEGAGARHADWFSPACDPADDEAVAGAATRVLDRLPGLWRIDRALAGDGWLDALRGATSERSGFRVTNRPESAVLSVAPLGEDAGATGKTGRETRRYRRRAEEHGLRMRLSDDAADFDALLALHTARWGPDHFDEADRAFHRAFARRAAERGWLRLYVFETPDRVAAATYGWRIGGTAFGYLQAFDPEFGEYRPGMVLADHAVREAAAEGCAEFNMLRGGEGYKRALGAETRELTSASVLRPHTPTSFFVRTLARGRSAWRHLPEASRTRLRTFVQL